MRLRYIVRDDCGRVIDLVRLQSNKAQSLIDGKQSVFFKGLEPRTDGTRPVTFEIGGGNADDGYWQNTIAGDLNRIRNKRKRTKPRKSVPITEELKADIVQRRFDKGQKIAYIAKKVGVSQTTVSRNLRQQKKAPTVHRNDGGRTHCSAIRVITSVWLLLT